MGIPPRTVVFAANSDRFFVSHRLALARALRDRGHRPIVAAGEDGGRAALESENIEFVPVEFDRGGRSMTRDARTLAQIAALYRRLRPDLVHHVTVKPILYGSLAARVVGVPAVVNAVSGLGYVFIDRDGRDWKHHALRALVWQGYRVALAGNRTRVIFQNPDDRELFVGSGLVRGDRTSLVHGAGVDIERFRATPLPSEGVPVVVLPARMLWDKGVGEFVKAARTLRARGVTARFVLVGGVDASNPAGIPLGQLKQWVGEGGIEWWGHRADMARVFAECTLVALPSYREGMPLALGEAAASGRASVAADVPGCREIVRSGETGWLVPVRSTEGLADTIAAALGDRAELARRGRLARALVEREFSSAAVLEATFAVYASLLGSEALAPR